MLLTFFIRFAAETIFLSLLAYTVFRWGSLSRLFKAFDRSTRFRLLTFLSICFFAQCVDRLQYNFPPLFDLFPFARFAMYQYATVKDPVTAYRFEGVYPDGSREHINFTAEFSAIGVPAISSRFRVIAEKADSSSEADRAWAEDQTRMFLKSLARKRADQHTPTPESFDLLVLSKSITAPAELPAERRLLLSFKTEEL